MSEYIKHRDGLIFIDNIETCEATNPEDAMVLTDKVGRYVSSFEKANAQLREQLAAAQERIAELEVENEALDDFATPISAAIYDADKILVEIDSEVIETPLSVSKLMEAWDAYNSTALNHASENAPTGEGE